MDIKSFLACETVRDKAIALLVCALLAVALAVGLGYLSYLAVGPVSSGTWYNKYLILFFCMAIFTLGSFFVFRKDMDVRPERLFFVIVLVFTVGSSVAYDVNKVSWDVESHFKFMLQWSELDRQIELNQSEYEELYGYAAQIETSIADLNAWKAALNDGEDVVVDEVVSVSATTIYSRIPSIPGSLVYALCTAIGIPFSLKYVLVKLIYALIYSFVCYRGMRLLASGKMIFAAVAMLPVALFLASNYSYDYWLICFLLYASARLVGELQRPDQKLTFKSAFFIFGAFVLACAPKAVYFPVAALPLLMPKSKFEKSAHSRIFRAACFAVPLLIAATFLLGFFGSVSSGSNVGDMRGGSDIDSTGQCLYILSDVPGYFYTVLHFIFSSYAFDVVRNTAFLAYLGSPEWPTWILSALLLAFAIFTDKEAVDRLYVSTWKSRVWSIFLAAVSLFLVITSMYVSFTSVGSSSVLGVQPRYAIPIMALPALFLGIPKWGEKIRVGHEKTYNTIMIAGLTVIPYIALWQTYISLLA